MVPPGTRALPTPHSRTVCHPRFPMGGEELADLSELCRRQAGQHIGEIFMRAQASPPATAQDVIYHRAAPSRLGVTNEEPSLAAHRRGANIVFHEVVVDLKASVLEISDQGVMLVQKIIHRLAQRALR